MKEAIKGSPHNEGGHQGEPSPVHTLANQGGNQRGNQAHQSTPLPCPLDRMSSGARYSGVPQSVHVRSTIFLANPKSHTCHKRDAARGQKSLTLQKPSSSVIKGHQGLIKGNQELIKHTLQKPSSSIIKGHQELIKGHQELIKGHQELIKHTLQKPRASRSRFSGLRSR